MALPTSKQELASLLGHLGARDPEAWAQSQVSEGIPQLHRFLFLRQAWKQIVSECSPARIPQRISEYQHRPNDPYADVGRVLKACLDRGVSTEDLSALAKALQAEALFQFCYLLDDPQIDEPEGQSVDWGLFCVNETDEPAERIQGLHESVLETDPSGREVRPQGRQI